MTTPPHTPPKKLFALLRYLAIDQNTVAAKLDISHTLVSLWAHGKKPIPPHHQAAIATLINTTVGHHLTGYETHMAQARQRLNALDAQAEPPEPQELEEALAELKQAIQASTSGVATLKALLGEWSLETYARSGELLRILYAQCRIAGTYGTRQPQALAPEERQILHDALTQGLAQLRYLEMSDPTPTEILERLTTHKPPFAEQQEGRRAG